MNYPFILKFSSITNLSDARFAAGSWADFVGFCFDPALPDYIEPARAKEIAGWINGPLLTGEFGSQPIEWIKDFIHALSLQAIQVPSTYQDGEILNLGVRVIVKVDRPEETPLMRKADLLLASDPQIYSYLKMLFEQPVILAFDNTELKAGNYDGIDFHGIREDKPGTRNHALWNEILEPYMG
jgi:phosphoribosylanthranilate isomerase